LRFAIAARHVPAVVLVDFRRRESAMSIPIATERSLLSYDEFETVRRSHYPFISGLSADELRALRSDLRDRRSKASTIARRQRREVRGKTQPRGSTPARDDMHAMRRKQIFVQAVKRLNRELHRLDEAVNRPTPLIESAQRALEMLRANRAVHHPSSGRTAGRGMQPKPSERRTVEMDPREVGRVSQAVKVAQARRDA
jgi:hypothetical protein